MYVNDHQVYQSGSNTKAVISELAKEAENITLAQLEGKPSPYQSKEVPSFSNDDTKH